MRFAPWDTKESRESLIKKAEAIVGTALELGINLIDHADLYGAGICEEIFGDLLKRNPIWREQIILQTKCGIQHQDGIGRYNHRPDYILDCIDKSLQRLQSEQIDVFLLHRPDPLLDPEAIASAFSKARSEGKVRYFGVSNYSKAQIELLQKYLDAPLVANQIQLSLLHPWPLSEGVFVNHEDAVFTGIEGTVEHCRMQDIQVQAWSPIASGQLSNPSDKDNPRSLAVREVLSGISQETGYTYEAIGLAWILKHPAKVVPIVGTQSPDRLRSMTQALEIHLSDLQWWKLFRAALGRDLP